MLSLRAPQEKSSSPTGHFHGREAISVLLEFRLTPHSVILVGRVCVCLCGCRYITLRGKYSNREQRTSTDVLPSRLPRFSSPFGLWLHHDLPTSHGTLASRYSADRRFLSSRLPAFSRQHAEMTRHPSTNSNVRCGTNSPAERRSFLFACHFLFI